MFQVLPMSLLEVLVHVGLASSYKELDETQVRLV